MGSRSERWSGAGGGKALKVLEGSGFHLERKREPVQELEQKCDMV